MSRAMDPPFATVDLPGGVRFVLPRRIGGTVRIFGQVMMMFGLTIIGVIAAIAAKHVYDTGDWFGALMGMSLAGTGLLFSAFGATIVYSRCLVELRHDKLVLIERLGLFTKRWSRPINALESMQVHRSGLKINGKTVPSQWWSDLSAIKAQFESDHTLALAAMYPFATAHALAQAIARQIDVMLPDRIGSERRPLIQVVDEHIFDGDEVPPAADAEAPNEPLQWPDPPATSTVIYEVTGQNVHIRVPPTGFFGAPRVRTLSIFTLVWCGWMSVIFVATVIHNWHFLLLMLPFWAISIALACASMHFARRQVIFDIVDDALLITYTGLRRVKQVAWRREQIKAIRCGSSNTKVNNKPLMQLQFEPHEGKTVKLLTGRDEAELQWIAQILRLALRRP